MHSVYIDLSVFRQRELFDFLEVYIADVVVSALVGGGAGIVGLATLSLLGAGLLLGVEDVLLGLAELGFDFLDGGFDGCDVLILVGFLR